MPLGVGFHLVVGIGPITLSALLMSVVGVQITSHVSVGTRLGPVGPKPSGPDRPMSP